MIANGTIVSGTVNILIGLRVRSGAGTEFSLAGDALPNKTSFTGEVVVNANSEVWLKLYTVNGVAVSGKYIAGWYTLYSPVDPPAAPVPSTPAKPKQISVRADVTNDGVEDVVVVTIIEPNGYPVKVMVGTSLTELTEFERIAE